jgi:GNAT superfamily N-acetyltransferase
MNKTQIKQPDIKSNVNKAGPGDGAPALDTIVLAFSADPQLRWLWPEADAYLKYGPRFFEAFGGNAFSNDTAFYTRDFSGVALWLPPGVHADEEGLLALLETAAPTSKLPIVMEVFEQMDHYQPDEPHWHLPLIGVDPPKQGSGYGSQLLQFTLDEIDNRGEIAYLENTNPVNTPLYERFGFEIVDVIRVDGAPPLSPMIRYPTADS